MKKPSYSAFAFCVITACLLASHASAQSVKCTNTPVPVCNSTSRFRTLSGVCNNLRNPLFGAVNTPFRRLLPADYADGVSEPRRSQDPQVPLPNARSVSLAAFRNFDLRSPRLSHMATIFGQFLAHDITLAGGAEEEAECIEPDGSCTPIELNENCVGIPTVGGEQALPDSFFPGSDGVKCIRVARNRACNELQEPREQVNILTPFIDASHIYGTNDQELTNITNQRSFNSLGLLATRPQNISSLENLLPPSVNPHTLCLSPDPVSRPCFVTGDFRRNNENTALNAMHTIWVREHNRIALQLHFLNPTWDARWLFEESRKIVGAMMQHITYNEFLPIMLGQGNVARFDLGLLSGTERFRGYSPDVNPSLPNSMATAALRFGHSTVREIFSRIGDNFKRFPDLQVKEFHNPEFIYDAGNGGVDSVIRGMALQQAGNIDPFFADALRQFVIPEDGRRADLMAINIQRGREHGLPGYNKFREFCRLRRALSFRDCETEIPRKTIRLLSQIYESVDDIDLFVGGISERPPPGQGLGPTFACILGHAFKGLRFGDRFWYEGNVRRVRFTRAQLEALRNASLARIICDNSDGIRNIQPRVLLQRDFKLNKFETKCEDLPFVDLNAWQSP